MSLIIKTFREPPLDNNNYVVIEPISHEAILIDCSAPDRTIMDYIQTQNAHLSYILITHTHFDHILGIEEMTKAYQVPAYAHPADFPLLRDMNNWISHFMGFPPVNIPEIKPLPDRLKIGNIPIQVIETAGHTPGGVCYLIEDHLFSGDTLFKGTYGRVDIPMSNPADMRDSLGRLMHLPPETSVYPGHGHPTTIGAEQGKYE